MTFSTLFLSALIACGEKTNDTSSETDTGETGDTGAAVDTGETGDAPDTNETGDTVDSGGGDSSGDSGETGDVPDDSGTGENTSSTPPTGTCMENTVKIQAQDDTIFLKHFIWEMEEGPDGPRVFMGGYNSGTVNVCDGLVTEDPLNFAQVNITFSPNLSQLPQLVGVGVFGFTPDISGELMFIPDPLSEDFVSYMSLEGEATLDSFIEGEKALMSELQIGQMGVPTEDFSDFTPIDIQLSDGLNVVACYCEGLIEFYNNLGGEEPE